MIGDSSRTFAYRKGILNNYARLYQKTVLDVGAGTGILSMFCAQAGAKRVYAIEASDVAQVARKVVSSNGVEQQVEVIQSRVEDADLPDKVDVIVSEWMGYMLLYESMLQSVIYARDKWLKKDGVLLPEKARMFIAPLTDPDEGLERVEFWKMVKDNFHVDMSCVVEFAKAELYKHITVKAVDVENVISRGTCFLELDLYTVKPEDLHSVEEEFVCCCYGHGKVHAFVIWFSVEFPQDVILSTSPYDSETHWQQTVLYINPVDVKQDSIIRGTITINPSAEHHRMLDIHLTFTVDGKQRRKQVYRMNDYSP
ncbi:protein arginine N-methyltransferase 6-like isoform X2 [Ornithodoros turicata]